MNRFPIQIQHKVGEEYQTIYASISLPVLMQTFRGLGYLNGNTIQELFQLLQKRNWKLKWRAL